MDDQRIVGEAIAGGLAASGEFWVLGRRAMDDPGGPGAISSLQPDMVVLCSTGRAPEVGPLIKRITVTGPRAAVVLVRAALDAATAGWQCELPPGHTAILPHQPPPRAVRDITRSAAARRGKVALSRCSQNKYSR
jgi:hypothetical protein